MDELLRAGAEVDAYAQWWQSLNNSTATALQIASYYGNYNVVDKLLRSGADINARGGSGHGLTALSAAAMRGRLDVVHLLVANNPHQHKLKHECSRAAKHARFNQHHQIAKILESVVTSLVEKLGRDEEDDWIDRVYMCVIKSRNWYTAKQMCSECQHMRSTQPRKWYSKLLHFGNLFQTLPRRTGFWLERPLSADETLQEIDDLLKVVEDEEIESEDSWPSPDAGQESDHNDEGADHDVGIYEPSDTFEADIDFDGY